MRKDLLALTGSHFDGLVFNTLRSANVAAGQEVPFLLLRNPSASGRALRNLILEINFTGTAVFTISAYINPTITNNGNSLTIRSHLVKDSPPSSKINVYGAPTISNNGTLGKQVAISNQRGFMDLSRSLIMFPNRDILFTAQHTGLVTNGLNLFPEWAEVAL